MRTTDAEAELLASLRAAGLPLPTAVEWSFGADHKAFHATVEELHGFRGPLESGTVPHAVIVEQQTV